MKEVNPKTFLNLSNSPHILENEKFSTVFPEMKNFNAGAGLPIKSDEPQLMRALLKKDICWYACMCMSIKLLFPHVSSASFLFIFCCVFSFSRSWSSAQP
jgi:hypothetical protein